MWKTALDLQFDAGDFPELDDPGHEIAVEQRGPTRNVDVLAGPFPSNSRVFLRAHGAKLPQ